MRNVRFTLGVTAACLLVAVLSTRSLSSAEPTATAPTAWTNDLSPITAADWTYDRAAHLL